ncbi:MAG: hypothetical protein Athens071416_60 [Parcubacteria group bacterium Athens0714_16]|nr:MAG: hypothetical protein Athens071416_60 [Parcubacteria group bacterium Athens0714_16]
MKKLAVLFVLLVSSLVLFQACGTTPDQNEDEIKVFLNGKGYSDITKIVEVKTEPPSAISAYFVKENNGKREYFDYVVLAKRENKNFLLFVQSDGNFPIIKDEISIDIVAVDTKLLKDKKIH